MQQRPGGYQPPRQPWDDYLKEGYFDANGHLRVEVVETEAVKAAKWLGNAEPKMTSHQLRRFFNKMRALEQRLEREPDFGAIRAGIAAFGRDAAYAVGRGVAPEVLKVIVDRNVALAQRDERSFREGFMEHFESIVAYFVFYFRDRERSGR